MKKLIVTITGIRPDFIRMSRVFERLDEHFEHVMVHTGQHYDDELSKLFFDELQIRKPDHVLATGRKSTTHYEQLAYLSTELIQLFKQKGIRPDLCLFLGDSNSALASVPLFKEGFRIGHIEGGMRSYDRRMPEEVNRVICDYVSDFVFVYTPLYRERLLRENKDPGCVHVVGNTIVEIVQRYRPTGPRRRDFVLADIHRNENLSSVEQLNHVLTYLEGVGLELDMQVRLVRFRRAQRTIEAHNLLQDKPHIEPVGPYGFLQFLELQYHAYGAISDSGTCQEECPLLGVAVAVPRNFTERPESVENQNSILVGETRPIPEMVSKTVDFFRNYSCGAPQLQWLGDGKTSERIVNILRTELN